MAETVTESGGLVSVPVGAGDGPCVGGPVSVPVGAGIGWEWDWWPSRCRSVLESGGRRRAASFLVAYWGLPGGLLPPGGVLGASWWPPAS